MTFKLRLAVLLFGCLAVVAFPPKALTQTLGCVSGCDHAIGVYALGGGYGSTEYRPYKAIRNFHNGVVLGGVFKSTGGDYEFRMYPGGTSYCSPCPGSCMTSLVGEPTEWLTVPGRDSCSGIDVPGP